MKVMVDFVVTLYIIHVVTLYIIQYTDYLTNKLRSQSAKIVYLVHLLQYQCYPNCSHIKEFCIS